MKAFWKAALVCALPWLAIAQVATLQIKVLEGDGAVHPPGAHLSKPLTVAVTDEAGRPMAGATVSFQLPAEGPGGVFPNGLRTDLALTDASGRATLHAIQLNNTAGQFHLRITAVKEQARAGTISVQYIGGAEAAPAAVAATGTPEPAPARAAAPAPRSPGLTPTVKTADKRTSPGLTRTPASMRPHSSKKWLILAVAAAAGGAAFAGISRSKSGSPSGTISSSVVSIGTPTITVGHP